MPARLQPTPATAALPRGSSMFTDPVAAARDLAQQLRGAPAALRIVFVSPEYDLDLLGPALAGELADAPLIGCTTAGEIGPAGYLVRPGLVGAALPADDFEVELVEVPHLRAQGLAELGRLAAEGAARHAAREPRCATCSFAVLLVDGLAVREEQLVSAIHGNLRGIPLCGGSAGDGLRFGATHLLVDGSFRSDHATLALVRTSRRFEVFQRQHFAPTGRKLVVTAADPVRRIVHELDGDVAARAYADAVGCAVSELSPAVFSAHPVVVRVGGTDHVRSTQKADADGSLTFYCAIDDGIVLTVAEGRDMRANLAAEVERLTAALGEVDLTLGFDCILRRLEAQQKGHVAAIDEQLRRLGLVGFATYGEQCNAMHVNQTLTGVALGRSRRG